MKNARITILGYKKGSKSIKHAPKLHKTYPKWFFLNTKSKNIENFKRSFSWFCCSFEWLCLRTSRNFFHIFQNTRVSSTIQTIGVDQVLDQNLTNGSDTWFLSFSYLSHGRISKIEKILGGPPPKVLLWWAYSVGLKYKDLENGFLTSQ